jgi:hypothetical protein
MIFQARMASPLYVADIRRLLLNMIHHFSLYAVLHYTEGDWRFWKPSRSIARSYDHETTATTYSAQLSKVCPIRDSNLSEPCMLRTLYSNYRVLRNTSNSFTTKYIHTQKARTQRTQNIKWILYLCQFAREWRQTILTRNTCCDAICANLVLCRDQPGITSLSLTQLHGPTTSPLYDPCITGKDGRMSMYVVWYNGCQCMSDSWYWLVVDVPFASRTQNIGTNTVGGRM